LLFFIFDQERPNQSNGYKSVMDELVIGYVPISHKHGTSGCRWSLATA